MIRINYKALRGLSYDDGYLKADDFEAYFEYRFSANGMELVNLSIKNCICNYDTAYEMAEFLVAEDCEKHGVELIQVPAPSQQLSSIYPPLI